MQTKAVPCAGLRGCSLLLFPTCCSIAPSSAWWSLEILSNSSAGGRQSTLDGFSHLKPAPSKAATQSCSNPSCMAGRWLVEQLIMWPDVVHVSKPASTHPPPTDAAHASVGQHQCTGVKGELEGTEQCKDSMRWLGVGSGVLGRAQLPRHHVMTWALLHASLLLTAPLHSPTPSTHRLAFKACRRGAIAAQACSNHHCTPMRLLSPLHSPAPPTQ